jgi:hypothetical protein
LKEKGGATAFTTTNRAKEEVINTIKRIKDQINEKESSR